MDSNLFYQSLHAEKLSLSVLLSDSSRFHEVPSDWYIFVTDVVNSTKAVQNGNDKEVNLVAASSIIAAINLAARYHLEVPFVFAGDGTIILCPPMLVSDMAAVLAAHRSHCRKIFGLDLRVGMIPVHTLYRAGYTLAIARQFVTAFYAQAVFIGPGVAIAEEWVKRNDTYHLPGEGDPLLYDLTGLECRWNTVRPPDKMPEVVCLIVKTHQQADEVPVYGKLLHVLDQIYGTFEMRHPVHPSKMRLLISLRNLGNETLMKKGRRKAGALLRLFSRVTGGLFYFGWNLKAGDVRGNEYKQQLVAATDTLKIDGTLKTIFAGTFEQRIQLLDMLNELETQGVLSYGHFVSSASVMTCYVKNLNREHFHFLDGFGGGYTRAAYEFKSKIRQYEQRTTGSGAG